MEAAARSLIYDGQTVRPAFRDIVLRFSDQWLGLSRLFNAKKDATLYPAFNPQIQDSMMEETRRLFSSVIFDDKGSVASLMTAPYTFVDATLAKYYGFGAATGTEFVRVNKPPTWGVGFMSQGSMLSVLANGISTSPTRRGHMVRSTLLCTAVPPPPPVVDPIPEPTEAQTTRQRYEQLHASNAACSGCHKLIDPIGFAFEHLDPAGRFRQKEGAFDIDDSAVITATSKGDLTVKGPTELASALASLPELNDCMGAYLAAYALGLSHDSAQCLVSSATAELRKGGSHRRLLPSYRAERSLPPEAMTMTLSWKRSLMVVGALAGCLLPPRRAPNRSSCSTSPTPTPTRTTPTTASAGRR